MVTYGCVCYANKAKAQGQDEWRVKAQDQHEVWIRQIKKKAGKESNKYLNSNISAWLNKEVLREKMTLLEIKYLPLHFVVEVGWHTGPNSTKLIKYFLCLCVCVCLRV